MEDNIFSIRYLITVRGNPATRYDAVRSLRSTLAGTARSPPIISYFTIGGYLFAMLEHKRHRKLARSRARRAFHYRSISRPKTKNASSYLRDTSVSQAVCFPREFLQRNDYRASSTYRGFFVTREFPCERFPRIFASFRGNINRD